MASNNSPILGRVSNIQNIEAAQKTAFFQLLARCQKTQEFKNVLSVSTGIGVWDYLLLKKCKNVESLIATDIINCPVDLNDTQMLNELTQWSYVKVEPESKLPFQDQSFDLVFHHDVIEHVSKPFLFLSEQYRVLRPGGALILSTPNLLRPFNIARLLTGSLIFPKKIGGNEVLGDLVHIHEFSECELLLLLKEIGFKDVKLLPTYFGFGQFKLFEIPRKPPFSSLCHILSISATK